MGLPVGYNFDTSCVPFGNPLSHYHSSRLLLDLNNELIDSHGPFPGKSISHTPPSRLYKSRSNILNALYFKQFF